MYFSEADEIRVQRSAPSSHPLQRTSLSSVHEAPTTARETTLILSTDASHQSGQVFRRCVRELVNMRSHPTVRLWFYSNEPGQVDFATGKVYSWSDNGEISFLGGTRLNDRLLVRVTF